MTKNDRDELVILRRRVSPINQRIADLEQKEFEAKLPPDLDLWRRMQAKNPWMK